MRFKRVIALGAGGAVVLAFVLGRLNGGVKERIGIPMNGKIEKSDAEWREQLTPEQYHVTRQKGTERAFTGAYWNAKGDGVFECVCCGQPLFDATTKYDSCTGWPSFYDAVEENNVSLISDNSWLMQRTEVVCSRCNAHLGHVFPDGPQPTGMRYCINSTSLKLAKRGDPSPNVKSEGDAKPE